MADAELMANRLVSAGVPVRPAGVGPAGARLPGGRLVAARGPRRDRRDRLVRPSASPTGGVAEHAPAAGPPPAARRRPHRRTLSLCPVPTSSPSSPRSPAWSGSSYGGRTHAVWHDGSATRSASCPAAASRPLPDLAAQPSVTVLLRSKATRALVAEVEATVHRGRHPASEHWAPVTAALKAGRLNLSDAGTAIDRWARESVVVRLVPQGAPSLPGALDSSLAATWPPLSAALILRSRASRRPHDNETRGVRQP